MSDEFPKNENLTADMEENLKADRSGELKKELNLQITSQIEKVDKALSAGVSPEEFKRLSTIKVGLQSALVVLERIWLYYHSKE